jgi:hypothetical protein
MSGRLVILPKKSYCPWKPENVARVQRDEEQHQTQLEQRLQSEKQQCGQERNRLLLQRKLAKDDQEETSLQHVNLFQAEEDRANKKEALWSAQHHHHNHHEGGSKRSHHCSTSTIDTNSGHQDSKRDEDRKAAMDPALLFMRNNNPNNNKRLHDTIIVKEPAGTIRQRIAKKEKDIDDGSDNGSDARRKRKKHRKKEAKRKTKQSIGATDLEGLRRRRRERESNEQLRQAELTTRTSQNFRQYRYNDQYHPTLARS